MINLVLNGAAGRTISCQLKEGFTLDDFRKLVVEQLGSEALTRYRYTILKTTLNLDDERIFNGQKRDITNNTTIYYLKRLHGGASSMSQITNTLEQIRSKYRLEIPLMQTTTAKCISCLDTKQCLAICCEKLCGDCFSRKFEMNLDRLERMEVTKFLWICDVPKCHRIVPFNEMFRRMDFLNLIEALDTAKALVNNIDCQICKCGEFIMNEQLYSKQQCDTCNRWFCFFCNRDWNSSRMTNQLYTCGYNCEYETKLSYELVPLLKFFSYKLCVPSRRVCPKCGYTGAFDEQCKYHQCTNCRYTFCFICLESEADCKRKYSTSYDKPCGALKKQDYSIFPRLIKM